MKTPAKHKIHKLKSGVKIQQYNNGSFAYYNGKGWRNIPSELAIVLIEDFQNPAN